MGQSLPKWAFRAMSGLSPKATGQRTSQHFRKVPRTEVGSLLDHLIGAGDERRREVYAERLRGPEVDNQLVFRGRLHR